jgi:restriction system protein
MTALDAAEQVLAQAGHPLHVSEITNRILAAGLWQSAGKTPAATIEARLAVDIKTKSNLSRFRRVAKRTYALASTPIQATPAAPAISTGKIADVASKALSFTDAAEHVLDQFAAKKPMHYTAITEKALNLGLIVTSGQTPAATMYAMIITEIERQTKRGEQPRFAKLGRGLFGLGKWQPAGVAALIDQHNREVRRKVHAQLLTMKSADFEALIGRLLTALGFEAVNVTPASGDGGIDVRGQLVVGDVVRMRMAVQVKRWKNNIQAPMVQQVRGSLGVHEQGLIITTSDFSKGASEEAAKPTATPVALMNGTQLVNLLIEHRLGVRRTPHDLIELGEDEE